MDEQVTAGLDVLAERFRQIEEYGYSFEHDDRQNQNGELVTAAMYYAATDDLRASLEANGFKLSSFHAQAFDPKDRRSNLVCAAALLVAEIERLDRLSKRPRC